MKKRERFSNIKAVSEEKAAPMREKFIDTAEARRFRTMSILIFSLYIFLLVWLISLKCNMKVTITDTYYLFKGMSAADKLQIAKKSFLSLLNKSTWKAVWAHPRQDILNVVAFLPFGLYLGYFIGSRKLPKTIAASFVLSLCFEAMQLITHIGYFDSLDLVTNTLGGTLGCLLYKLIYRDTQKRIRVLNVVSYVALGMAAVLASYALVKTIAMLDFYFAILSGRY